MRIKTNSAAASHHPSVYLWFVCLVAAVGGLLFGYDAVVVSGTNSQVEKQFNFTDAQLGFYVSCVLWGCASGSMLAGFIADAFGRKKLLLGASILILISAIWSALASSVIPLICARLIGGVGIGIATMVCPLYISEISPERHRGRMVTLFQLTITIGIIMCVFMNWGIFLFAEGQKNADLPKFVRWILIDENWRMMFGAESIPSLLFMVCAIFLPESPRWLIKQGRKDQALEVLQRVNQFERAREIADEIDQTVSSEGKVRFMDLFTGRLVRPLMLALGICVFSEACGVSVVFYYGPQLLEKAGLGLGKSLGGFATIAIINFIATLFALKYMDTTGRRKMLTIGSVGCIISHLAIGILYLTHPTGLAIVIAINAFIAFFACALGPTKFVVISEIFPNRIRGQAVAIATFCIWVTSAIVAQLFPVLQGMMDTGYIFFCFIIVLLLLLAVVRWMLPETKGRTIEEIEKSWL